MVKILRNNFDKKTKVPILALELAYKIENYAI